MVVMGPEIDETDQQNDDNAFDINRELSKLVDKKVLPSKIAKKLKEKIRENNIDITREQLYIIVDKIKEALSNYNAPQSPKTDSSKVFPPEKRDDVEMDMLKILEKIDVLSRRIDEIESSLLRQLDKKNSSEMIVTSNEYTSSGKHAFDIEGKPYAESLTELPSDPENVIVLMKWMQYLIDRCGRENLSRVLDYYVDIGWISEDVKINLLDYSQGISDENVNNMEKRDVADLPSRDHIQSFLFIQKLKGRNFDKHFLDRIDGEISRLTKKIDGCIQ